MAIDYSKWDKIELSDDSDIEVHPNVDKKSMVRMLREKKHQERAERNQNILNMETQIKMYEHLNTRVDRLLAAADDSLLVDASALSKWLNANFDPKEKLDVQETSTFNEMVEDLFASLKDEAKKQNQDPENPMVIRILVLGHRAKITQVTAQAQDKLKELYEEKARHISSEDYHTGFDSSFINKDKAVASTPSTTDATATTTTVQSSASTPVASKPAISSSAAAKPATSTSTSKSVVSQKPAQPTSFTEYEDVLKLHPDTIEFSNIPTVNQQAAKQFLIDHMHIISPQQKDALLMLGFETHDLKRRYQICYQSELLSYIREIYDYKRIPIMHPVELKNIIENFFSRVFSQDKAKNAFLSDVQRKCDHITQRLESGAFQEAEEEGERETLQLRSLDENSELVINMPDESSHDEQEKLKVAAFYKLPAEMQTAVRSQKLDNINLVFDKMSFEDAEALLEIFDEAGIISVNAVLENEGEFEQLKEQYQNMSVEDTENTREEPPVREEQPLSTADMVD